LSEGAIQEITDWRSAYEDAVTRVGESGTVAGTAAADAVEAVEVPEAFVAVTLNVYEVPLVRPVTVHGFDRPHEKAACATVPTNGVTVKAVIAAPLAAGAVHDTFDWVDSNEVAETPVGAPGTVDGVAEFDATDTAPVPARFVAVTVNVYALPFVRPGTVQVVAPVVVQVFAPGVDVTV